MLLIYYYFNIIIIRVFICILRDIYNNVDNNVSVYEYKFLLTYLIKILAVTSEIGVGDECPAVIVNALKEMKKRENLKKGVEAFVTESGYSRPQLLRLVKKYLNMTPLEFRKGKGVNSIK